MDSARNHRPVLVAESKWLITLEMYNEFVSKLIDLRVEHADLDTAIIALVASPHSDELQIKRLKKRKLAIKDVITRMESKLIPDIDA